MSNPSPAPWRLNPLRLAEILDATGTPVAICNVLNVAAYTYCSNTYLIAAAPELLDMLERLADQLERVGDTRARKDGALIDDAREAIAKARHETYARQYSEANP